ncbi:MAG: OadG family protein [Pirellulales bacterium]|nr:OadG family protein [Pirellulales bacterium]
MNHANLAATEMPSLLALIDWQPLWEDKGLPLALMGLLVVFAALILVCVFIATLPKMMSFLDRFFPETREAAHAAEAQRTTTDEIPEATLAVIAAVVADTVGVRHRIVRTRQLSSEDLSWTLEGRLQHHASHRLQPRDPRHKS